VQIQNSENFEEEKSLVAYQHDEEFSCLSTWKQSSNLKILTRRNQKMWIKRTPNKNINMNAYNPVQDIQDQWKIGETDNAMFGLALGYKSIVCNCSKFFCRNILNKVLSKINIKRWLVI